MVSLINFVKLYLHLPLFKYFCRKFLAISNDNEVNIYLYLYDFDSKEFAVKLSSCVLNNNNEKQFLKSIHEEAACFVEGCGFDNYLDSKYILDCRENFLQNDTLTLMFKVCAKFFFRVFYFP